MSADRGAYIDQSQSLEHLMENPTVAKLSSMHFYGWKKGAEDRNVLPAYACQGEAAAGDDRLPQSAKAPQ
jgi:hypothetical protein